jgi:putative heme transporter
MPGRGLTASNTSPCDLHCVHRDLDTAGGIFVVHDAGAPPGDALAPKKADRSGGPEKPRQWLRVATELLVLGGLIALGWLEHRTVSESFGVVGRADWGWLVVAGACELLSMMAFARTQRVVLRAAGVDLSIPSMAATALAGNAISVSLPLIGPGAGSVFTFGRFRQVAHDSAPAGWTLLISGLISNLMWVLLIAIGATASGNSAAIIGGLLGAGVTLATAIAIVLALRHPRWRRSVTRLGALVVRASQRLSGRPEGEPESVTRDALDALSAFRMRRSEWFQAFGLSFINWLASVACLIAAILAVGASVPWRNVILIFCAGATASSFNLTPGGLGVTEAVLAAGLVSSGVNPAAALGSALIYRIFSFWLVMLVGWAIYSGIRRKRTRIDVDGEILP